MSLEEALETLQRIREIDRNIIELSRSIQQIENEIRRRSSQIINLRDGTVKYNIDQEMRKKFGEEKIREIRRRIGELENEKKEILHGLERMYEKLYKEYNQELAKFSIVFKKFLKQLQSLEKTWKKLEELNQPLSVKHQCLWQMKTALTRDEKITLIPPYGNWRVNLIHAFTRLHGYLEEAEKHGAR